MHDTEDWYVNRNLMPETPVPDVRNTALYIGMQMGALGKKISVVNPTIGQWLLQYGLMFRSGECDQLVREAFEDPDKREAMLRHDMEVVWETVGAASALGAQVGNAYDYYEEERVLHDTGDGKVWTPPNLSGFLTA